MIFYHLLLITFLCWLVLSLQSHCFVASSFCLLMLFATFKYICCLWIFSDERNCNLFQLYCCSVCQWKFVYNLNNIWIELHNENANSQEIIRIIGVIIVEILIYSVIQCIRFLPMSRKVTRLLTVCVHKMLALNFVPRIVYFSAQLVESKPCNSA